MNFDQIVGLALQMLSMYPASCMLLVRVSMRKLFVLCMGYVQRVMVRLEEVRGGV